MYRNTYVQVNLNHLEENVKNIVKGYPDYTYYIGVVKGNGYGHGSYIVNTLLQAGVNYLAVSSLEEAIQIRKYNQNVPILCLEPIPVDYIKETIAHKVTLTISSLSYLKKLGSVVPYEAIKMHLKINTGMNRLGFQNKEEVKEAFDFIKSHYILEGIYTHFTTLGISDPYWDKQLQKFEELTSFIDIKQIPMVHLGRSLTLVNHPKVPFANGIRLGIIMYGFNQSPKINTSFKGKLKNIKAQMRIKKYHISETTLTSKAPVTPAFSLYSEIMEIQTVKKGDHVGYGLGYVAEEDMLVGIAPIGYADGLTRQNSGRKVWINQKKYPIIGSVNMGMIQIQIDENVKIGDKVELLGEHISVSYAASYIHTTPYECMCMIHEQVPRVYIKDNQIQYIEEWKV